MDGRRPDSGRDTELGLQAALRSAHAAPDACPSVRRHSLEFRAASQLGAFFQLTDSRVSWRRYPGHAQCPKLESSRCSLLQLTYKSEPGPPGSSGICPIDIFPFSISPPPVHAAVFTPIRLRKFLPVCHLHPHLLSVCHLHPHLLPAAAPDSDKSTTSSALTAARLLPSRFVRLPTGPCTVVPASQIGGTIRQRQKERPNPDQTPQTTCFPAYR